MAAIVLGGIHAGVGKSLLANGIADALRSQGLTVSSYAIGPGHQQSSSASSRCPSTLPQQPTGLDGWLLSADAMRAAFHSISAGSDISVIEGCLGMFDSPSADGSEQGCTAQVTQWLQVPVVLVVDAQAFNSVRGIVALIKGYTAVDGGLNIAGVILNKVSSQALPAELAQGLKQAGLQVAVLGGVPKLEELAGSNNSMPQQQLSCPWSAGSTASTSCSLVSSSQQQPACNLDMGSVVSQYIDLQQLRALAATAAVPQPQVPLPPAVRTYRVSMGVAYDEAFFQYFQQNLHMLRAAGVQLVPFSPVHDPQLPPGLSAVLLGGGAVAQWGEQLAANKPMLEAMRAFAAAGGLVIGEGAGLMYLSQSMQWPGQQRHTMVGLFPFHTQVQPDDLSQQLSYVSVDVQQSAHPLLLPGSQLRGLASCCCHVVEERLVGGLSAALAAATLTGACAAEQQQAAPLDSTSPLLSPRAAAGSSAGVADASQALQMTHSYSCVPLGQQGTAGSVAAIEEGYTCGTALASCVQVHYGSCPDLVAHMAQRCLRVDVASVTAAASAAATAAAAGAAEAAAAVAAALPGTAMRPVSPLILPESPKAVGTGLQEQQQQQQVQLSPGQSGRTISAPDLQQVVWQQCNAAGAGSDNAAPATGSATAPDSCWVASYPSTSALHIQGSPARKSASIPTNMYQLGTAPDQQQYMHQQQLLLAQQGQNVGMSRNSSFSQLGQQQQGWHPLPLHVPKRWSLELQRLGSFTSHLIPGAKSPTGQQHQQSHQQGRSHPSQHSRNSSCNMVHLPEEAPLSDAAIKVLDSSLPSLLGRTHQTHVGLAVPLSNSSGSSGAGAAAAAASGSVNAAGTSGGGAAGFTAAAGGPGSYLQRLESGSISTSSSIHEQMSHLAASLAQQEAVRGASAAPCRCDESTVCADCDSSVISAEQQQEEQGGICVGGWLPPTVHHRQQQLQQPQATGQRFSLDQQSVFSTHQMQQQLSVAQAGARMSFDSLLHPPAALARIQQQLSTAEEQHPPSSLPSQELSFKGMMQHSSGTPFGSSDKLFAAGGAGGAVSTSSSSSRLAVSATAAAPPAAALYGGGIISLSPAATDCFIALGLTSRLSGITDACRLGQQGSGSSSTGCPLAPLLDSLGAAWAKDAAADAAAAAIGGSSGNGSISKVPIVCRLVEGPDGLPRYKLDEDHIRRVQPSLVVVACEENSRDEPHVQHHQQLQAGARRQSSTGPASAGRAESTRHGAHDASAAANWSWPISPAGHVSSTMNGAVAVPGRVRLEMAVVQRVLQRAGVLWPEQRAVVLYQRCHSVSEVLEFMLVLANAAGVPERGVQLVAGLRARLRAAAGRLCGGSLNCTWNAARALPSRRGSNCSNFSTRSSCESLTGPGVARLVCPVTMVLENVNPVTVAGFWVSEMLDLVGAQQAAVNPAAAEPPRTVGWGQLRAAAPALLILAMPGLDAAQAALHTEQLASQPGFWTLPAVRSGAVYVVDHTLLCRPGPGVVLGVELLGHLVAPERQPLPVGLPMGSVLKLSLHSGQRCRPRLVPNYMARYC